MRCLTSLTCAPRASLNCSSCFCSKSWIRALVVVSILASCSASEFLCVRVRLFVRVCPFPPVVSILASCSASEFLCVRVSWFVRVCPFPPVVSILASCSASEFLCIRVCLFVCACVPNLPCGGLLFAPTPCDFCN